MTDPHSPRENDHLVEPMYAGLEVKGRARAGKTRARRLLWVSLALAAALLLAVLR